MKIAFVILGWLFVVVAAIGVVVPLLPTVPFLLLAAACFARSSQRCHQWLLSHRTFGKMITHWRMTRSIPKKSKYIAIVAIILSGTVSLFTINAMMPKIILLIFLAIPVVILLKLPNSEDLLSAKP